MKNIVEILKKYFEEKKEVKAVYLYGSSACGKNTIKSDIDIALLTEPYKTG